MHEKSQKEAEDQELCTGMDDGLSDELLHKAQVELGEDTEKRQMLVSQLRDAILDDAKLSVRTDDGFLIRFLRARNYDVDKSLKSVKTYQKMQRELLDPKLLTNLRLVLDLQTHHVLPYRDKHGRFIYVGRMGLWEPRKCSIDELFAAGWAFMEYALSSPEAQVAGLVTITDFKGLTLGLVRKISLADAKKLSIVIQEAFPLRFVQIHYVNNNFAFDVLFKMLKYLIQADILTKIVLHGTNFQNLHKLMGKENVPEDYAGTRPKMDSTEFYKAVVENTHNLSSKLFNNNNNSI